MNTVSIGQDLLEQGIDLGAVRAELGAVATTGAVPFRPERWNAYSQDGGGYQYQLASGDTLSGLAALYLDNSARWKEIWDLQPGYYKEARSPDVIYEDEWLEMPKEAGYNAKAMNGGTLPGSAGGAGGGGGGGEGGGGGAGLTETEPGAAKKVPTAVYVVGGAAVLGLLVYLAMKH